MAKPLYMDIVQNSYNWRSLYQYGTKAVCSQPIIDILIVPWQTILLSQVLSAKRLNSLSINSPTTLSACSLGDRSKSKPTSSPPLLSTNSSDLVMSRHSTVSTVKLPRRRSSLQCSTPILRGILTSSSGIDELYVGC